MSNPYRSPTFTNRFPVGPAKGLRRVWGFFYLLARKYRQWDIKSSHNYPVDEVIRRIDKGFTFDCEWCGKFSDERTYCSKCFWENHNGRKQLLMCRNCHEKKFGVNI